MLDQDTYWRIRYPDTAEHIEEYKNYRVFLEHWDPLCETFRQYFEIISSRPETRVLAIHGELGAGKTMFATKIIDDFNTTAAIGHGKIEPSTDNLWHRIAGGAHLSKVLIDKATRTTKIYPVNPKEVDWLDKLVTFVKANSGLQIIVVADNAERGYFQNGPFKFDDAKLMETASLPAFSSLFAQRFVDICRRDLRKCLFLIFSNDMPFLTNMQTEVGKQYRDIFQVTSLPSPTAEAKETIVRINTNKLNAVSYWFCLNNAGPNQKAAVYNALITDGGFRESFRALDEALDSAAEKNGRQGRPARKNLISLVVLFPGSTPPSWASNFAELEREEFNIQWAASYVYKSGWATAALGDTREATLLESEWQLRIIFLGEPFAEAIVAGQKIYCYRMLAKLKDYNSLAVPTKTRNKHIGYVDQIINGWPKVTVDTSAFWEAGQVRSGEYETFMRSIAPTYNTKVDGFLSFRPDLVVQKFTPCSIVGSQSANANRINEKIKRDAHVLEFTAIKNPTQASVAKYLQNKLPNYVTVTQDQ